MNENQWAGTGTGTGTGRRYGGRRNRICNLIQQSGRRSGNILRLYPYLFADCFSHGHIIAVVFRRVQDVSLCETWTQAIDTYPLLGEHWMFLKQEPTQHDMLPTLGPFKRAFGQPAPMSVPRALVAGV